MHVINVSSIPLESVFWYRFGCSHADGEGHEHCTGRTVCSSLDQLSACIRIDISSGDRLVSVFWYILRNNSGACGVRSAVCIYIHCNRPLDGRSDVDICSHHMNNHLLLLDVTELHAYLIMLAKHLFSVRVGSCHVCTITVVSIQCICLHIAIFPGSKQLMRPAACVIWVKGGWVNVSHNQLR